MMPKYVPLIHLFSGAQIRISRKLEPLRDKHRILSLQKARDIIKCFVWKGGKRGNEEKESSGRE